MRVLVAMSGGVDSAVAALLCKRSGYTPVGVILRLTGDTDISCETEAERDARLVAEKLGIEFHVEDLRPCFKEYVVDKFINDYLQGLTPNPCIDCNRHIKFGRMLEIADKYGCEKLATGHYARVTEDGDGNYRLQKAVDLSKDQSYMLYTLSNATLSRVLLPLGELTKADVRRIAAENGFTNANSKDSQDICFVPCGDYVQFIEESLGHSLPCGDFVNEKGEVLGQHRGHIRYTPGQRKGLGLSLRYPLYVKEKDAETNRVILCSEEGLMRSSVFIKNVNLICNEPIDSRTVYGVKARYGQTELPALISPAGEGRLCISFISPVRAPSPGQAAVIYKDGVVIGGGTVE